MRSTQACSILVFLLLLTANCIAQPTSNCKVLYSEEGKKSAYPRLSGDKKRILYQSNRNGNWQLFIREIDSGKEIQLTNDNSNNNFPDWSADNKWIAFVSDRDGNEEIYIMRTDGKELKRLTTDKARDIHPYFSPDGKQLLFNSTRGNGSFDIYQHTLETGKVLRLTSTEEDETCARFAPGMKKIVYLKNSAVSDDVYVLHVSSFLSDNLTNTPAIRDGWPMWSADGKWIYYSSMESGTYCIYRIQADGNNKQRLTVGRQGEEDARVCISNDGTMFIYNKQVGDDIDIRACDLAKK